MRIFYINWKDRVDIIWEIQIKPFKIMDIKMKLILPFCLAYVYGPATSYNQMSKNGEVSEYIFLNAWGY